MGADLNLLFWSREETLIEATDIQGQCYVKYIDQTENKTKDETFLGAPDRFYFQKSYDPWEEDFCSAPKKFLKPKVDPLIRQTLNG
jgi:DNA (cytosine-5)-methyltransferase 1